MVERVGKTMKKILVGTFYDGRRFSAYTTWYNPQWPGCIEYEIDAMNGTEAKKLAIKLRREKEGDSNVKPKLKAKSRDRREVAQPVPQSTNRHLCKAGCGYPVAYEGEYCLLCEEDGYD
jgi:hypothetical protein